VRPNPPGYVKPFVKRQTYDAADAEALYPALQRLSTHFVLMKSERPRELP